MSYQVRKGGKKMHIKTMEGLVGARTNQDLLKVPMRVYKDARRRGDMAVMERAMEYASDFAGKAKEYQAEAEEGMQEEAEEVKENAKIASEQAIEKRKDAQEQIDENLTEKTDSLELTEEGKILSKNNISQSENGYSKEEKISVKAPKIYTNMGTANLTEQVFRLLNTV